MNFIAIKKQIQQADGNTFELFTYYGESSQKDVENDLNLLKLNIPEFNFQIVKGSNYSVIFVKLRK